MGGLPRRATFISRQKEDLLPMVLLDAGNLFAERPLPESARETTYWKAELILTAMERMGYDAAALGEMDLYLGLDNLKALNELTSVRFLSANLVDNNGDNIFEPYVTLKAGDLKILVLGLTQLPTRPDLAVKRIGGCTVHDPIGTASRMVSEIRDKCDLLIVLSNLGHSMDLDLARSVKGIDIIIGGKSHRYTRKAAIVNSTLITSGYFQGRAMGQLMISYRGPVKGWVSSEILGFLDHQVRIAEERAAAGGDQDNLQKLISRRDLEARKTVYISDLVNLDPSFPDDPDILSMIGEYRRELHRTATMPPGKTSGKENPTHYTGPRICANCHGSRSRYWAGTRHAIAYNTLAAKGDGRNPDCLPCHVTGFGQATGYMPGQQRNDLGGITCESCHGIGSLHVASPKLYDLVASPPSFLCLKCHTKERDDDFDFLRDREIVCSELQEPGDRSREE